MWHAPNLAYEPRAGIAYRLNDKTSLRAGYALYYTPTEYLFTSAPVSGFEDIEFLEPPLFGVTGYQYAAALQNGVPQATLSNPFPASSPLVPIPGRAGGKKQKRPRRISTDLVPAKYAEGIQPPLQYSDSAGVAGADRCFSQ